MKEAMRMNIGRLYQYSGSMCRIILAIALLGILAQSTVFPVAASTKIDIVGPAGSGKFGKDVVVLPNGNIVVTDPNFNGGIGANAGAVYLYNGATGALISTATGKSPEDQIGSGGVVVLSNGNYVVVSPNWDPGGIYFDAGAVTWGDKNIGISGEISSANSLVGSRSIDRVGNGGVVALTNGNYVVSSPEWNNGGIVDAGAATWGNGSTGVMGLVSSSNSLVGSTADDKVSYYGAVVALSNGNYVVRSSLWNNGGIIDAGAVTWGNGSTGISGAVSASNSLVGSKTSDRICSEGVKALKNGNYVVNSPMWDNNLILDAGAVTWGNGITGVMGAVSLSNSLVGSSADDQVGNKNPVELANGNYVVASRKWNYGGIIDVGAVTFGNGSTGIVGVISTTNSLVGSTEFDWIGFNGVIALTNGNYIIFSPHWNNGEIVDAGAVTWGNGSTGITNVVTTTNSLVGSTTDDQVGSGGGIALTNGHYVVSTPDWTNDGIGNAGAATWGNGSTGITGEISTVNSLVGSTAEDQVSYSVMESCNMHALTNGNYVITSLYWDNGGIIDAGAVTWGNGLTGIAGEVLTNNSLVGSTISDQVGSGDVVVLTNGNYVVNSPDWDNSGIVDAGASTWGNGSTGISGAISMANSLVGSTTNDWISDGVSIALVNGNYLISSPGWNDGGLADIGAVTFGNGATGVTGVVSTANSLMGSTSSDMVGMGNITTLSNGDYVVKSSKWDSGGTIDAGAVTWGLGSSGVTGLVTGGNSVLGTAVGGGLSMVFEYDTVNNQLVVGRPADNIVTLFKLPYLYLPVIKK